MIHTVNELNKFNKNNPLYTLSFYYCKRLLIEEGAVYRSIISDRFKIVYVLSGKARLSTKRDSFHLNENDCFLCPKFKEFSLSECKNTKVYVVSFSYDAPLQFLEKAKPIYACKAEDLLWLLTELFESESYRQNLDGANEAAVLMLLQKLARLTSGDQNQLALYQKCCEYVENHVHLNLSASDVADALGYSKDHLGRVVKACSGKSLKALIDFIRVRKIKELAKNRHSSAVIAERLGFSSAELLRKYFRYQTGQNLPDYIRQNAFKKLD